MLSDLAYVSLEGACFKSIETCCLRSILALSRFIEIPLGCWRRHWSKSSRPCKGNLFVSFIYAGDKSYNGTFRLRTWVDIFCGWFCFDIWVLIVSTCSWARVDGGVIKDSPRRLNSRSCPMFKERCRWFSGLIREVLRSFLLTLIELLMIGPELFSCSMMLSLLAWLLSGDYSLRNDETPCMTVV